MTVMGLDDLAVQTAQFDLNHDITYAYILVSFAAGFCAVWVNQCLTSRAGFSDARRISIMMLRLVLGVLAASLFFSAVTALEITPSVAQVVERGVLLCLLVTLPRAISGKLGLRRAALLESMYGKGVA